MRKFIYLTLAIAALSTPLALANDDAAQLATALLTPSTEISATDEASIDSSSNALIDESTTEINRPLMARWRYVNVRGSTPWVRQDRPYCGHYSACSCRGQNYCGEYRNGQQANYWPNGCQWAPIVIQCEILR